MNDNVWDKFTGIANPSISVMNGRIVVRQRLFAAYIFIAVLAGICVIAVIGSEDKYDKPWGVILTSIFAFLCLHQLTMLPKVIIDANNRSISRSNFSPLVWVWDKFMQHPNIIPFENITRIEYDTDGLRTPNRFCVKMVTNDPYTFVITRFDDEELAKEFCQLVRSVIT